MSDYARNLSDDLSDRWRPSAKQIRYANVLIAAGANEESPHGRGVYTTHLLVNKSYGFWNLDVQVIPLDGYFMERGPALASLLAEVTRRREVAPDLLITGGYTWHHDVDEWAVFEDVATMQR